MSGDDKRRESRYKASVPVKLIRNREITSLTTEDVSFRGVFLRMDVPPALRQLLRLEVSLPDGPTLKVHAMVVFRVSPGASSPAGAGMQFFGLEGRERAQWDGFVQSVRDLLPKSKPGVDQEEPSIDIHVELESTPSVDSTPPSVDVWPLVDSRPPVASKPGVTIAPIVSIDERRAFERYLVRFEVRVSTMAELVTLYTRDISKGGMALETDMDLPPGTDVGLDLIHPTTRGTFELEATVRRKIKQGAATGLALEFKEMTPHRQEELERFINAAGPR